MADKIVDGGPAFPGGELRFDDGDCKTPYNAGMSLRDWFAGQATIAICALVAANKHDIDGPESVATDAYRVADAMLAARQKGGAS